MLGYYKVSTKQTTCGNCHVGRQSRWVKTKHALARRTLKDLNTAPTATCGIHTVNERGNRLTRPQRPARYRPDSAYQDVQCEACHGPGSLHVQNTRGARDLAVGARDDDGRRRLVCVVPQRHPTIRSPMSGS